MAGKLNLNGTEYDLDQSVEEVRDLITGALLRASGVVEVQVRFGASRAGPLLIRVDGIFAAAAYDVVASKARVVQ